MTREGMNAQGRRIMAQQEYIDMGDQTKATKRAPIERDKLSLCGNNRG